MLQGQQELSVFPKQELFVGAVEDDEQDAAAVLNAVVELQGKDLKQPLQEGRARRLRVRPLWGKP